MMRTAMNHSLSQLRAPKRKISGGAIQYVIVISIIISFVCMMILSIMLLHSRFLSSTLLYSQVTDRIDSSIERALQTPISDTSYTCRLNNKNFSIIQYTRPWGVYNILKTQANTSSVYNSRFILIGRKYDTLNLRTLCMPRSNAKLSIGQPSVLRGTCFIPGGYIRRDYSHEAKPDSIVKSEYTLIDSITYYQLPSPEFLERTRQYLTLELTTSDSIIHYWDYMENESSLRYHPFSARTILLYSLESIDMDEVKLQGNYIVCSGEQIIVRSNSLLNNIILYAQQISIEDNTQGAFQAYARESIDVGENCHLGPVCFLGVVGSGNMYLAVQAGTCIQGGLLLYNDSYAYRHSNQIDIQPTTTIAGLVYSNNYISHKGALYGEMYCNKFIHISQGDLRENYLPQAVINGMDLSPYFPMPYLFNTPEVQHTIIDEL